MPVLSFSCRSDSLSLIKEHFTELLANTMGKVQVRKKVNEMMFMKTNGHVVDILNSLGPRTSCNK